MIELNEHQQMIAQTVRNFVERDVIPVATEMEHRDEYPHALVETMKQLGLFGLNIPEEFGGNEIDYTTCAMIFEELSVDKIRRSPPRGRCHIRENIFSQPPRIRPPGNHDIMDVVL